MAENSAQEKTEEATPKRKEDARKKGQVPRSKELNTLTSLMAAGFGMLIFGKDIVTGINTMLKEQLSFGPEVLAETAQLPLVLVEVISGIIVLLTPLFIILVVTALVSPVSLGGWVCNFTQLAPKFERISPLKGLGRIFSVKSLMELVKAIAKFTLVATVTILVIQQALDTIFKLPLMPLSQAFNEAGDLFIWCFLGFSSVLIIVAAIDIPFQIFDFSKQLKMSRQEIKDEMKETDGKPEVKSAIRERQQEFARQRMMSEVPTADVIITNPTHFAVALRYDQTGTGAPKVVAKGKDIIAAKIREIARDNGVALFEAPPLARALYASTDLNQEIPANLFLAVAQVLAYIFQLRRAPNLRSKNALKRPNNFVIPEEYTKRENN